MLQTFPFSTIPKRKERGAYCRTAVALAT
jgi:hypothetical protein